MRHLDTLLRLNPPEIAEIFRLTADLKAKWKQGARPRLLDGRVMALLFEKPSLRTRISFEAAIAHLGGSSIFLSCAEAGLNGRESLPDVARVLGGYADWIVIRTFSHQLVDDFIEHAHCPIINGLSDLSHPCQALADLFTMQECFGKLPGKTLAFVGDGNNVARSLAVGANLLGVRFIHSAPKGYELSASFLKAVHDRLPNAEIVLEPDPLKAAAEADVIYTDVWASMGQESEQEKRRTVFAPYQVNGRMMAAARPDARFMHCLPARRGMEVTDEVMDSPASAVFEEAENRMHVAKGLLLWILGSDPVTA